MKKEYNGILAIVLLIAAHSSIYGRSGTVSSSIATTSIKKQEKKSAESSKNISASTKDLLATILSAAQNLTDMINKKSTLNREQGNRSKTILTEEIKKVPEENKDKISTYTKIIVREYNNFIHKRNHNQLRAQRALQNLSSLMKSIALKESNAVITDAQKTIQTAMQEVETAISEAQAIIDKAENEALSGELSRIEAAKIIAEQMITIDEAQNYLQEIIEEAQGTILEDDQRVSYFNSFTNAISRAISYVTAPFKAGYGYSVEQKEQARALITELQNQLSFMKENFQKAVKSPSLSAQAKAQINRKYAQSVQEIYDEIMAQELVMGIRMTPARKAFWAASAAATALAAYYLYKTYGIKTDTVQKVINDSLDNPVTDTAQNVITDSLDNPVTNTAQDVIAQTAPENEGFVKKGIKIFKKKAKERQEERYAETEKMLSDIYEEAAKKREKTAKEIKAAATKSWEHFGDEYPAMDKQSTTNTVQDAWERFQDEYNPHTVTQSDVSYWEQLRNYAKQGLQKAQKGIRPLGTQPLVETSPKHTAWEQFKNEFNLKSPDISSPSTWESFLAWAQGKLDSTKAALGYPTAQKAAGAALGGTALYGGYKMLQSPSKNENEGK